MFYFKTISIALVSSMMCLTINAQETNEAKAALPEAAQTVQLAGQLAKYGYAHNQALPLIQAAQLLKTVNIKPSNEKPEHEGGSEGSQKKDAASFDVNTLLTDAQALAESKGDKPCLDLIKQTKAQSRTVNNSTGYIRREDIIGPRKTDVWTVSFVGGTAAGVIVIGDGDTDLDLYVYDKYGNLLAKDIDTTDNCAVSFHPSYTGEYKIKIKNLGNISNVYKLYCF